jgi:uncharacterized membrane protein
VSFPIILSEEPNPAASSVAQPIAGEDLANLTTAQLRAQLAAAQDETRQLLAQLAAAHVDLPSALAYHPQTDGLAKRVTPAALQAGIDLS